jgi:hypothetical protein
MTVKHLLDGLPVLQDLGEIAERDHDEKRQRPPLQRQTDFGGQAQHMAGLLPGNGEAAGAHDRGEQRNRVVGKSGMRGCGSGVVHGGLSVWFLAIILENAKALCVPLHNIKPNKALGIVC